MSERRCLRKAQLAPLPNNQPCVPQRAPGHQVRVRQPISRRQAGVPGACVGNQGRVIEPLRQPALPRQVSGIPRTRVGNQGRVIESLRQPALPQQVSGIPRTRVGNQGRVIEPLRQPALPRQVSGIPRTCVGNQGRVIQPLRLPALPRQASGIPRTCVRNQGRVIQPLQPPALPQQVQVPSACVAPLVEPVVIPPAPPQCAIQPQEVFQVPPLPGMPYDPAFEQLSREEAERLNQPIGVPQQPDARRARAQAERLRVFEQLRRPLPVRIPRPSPNVGVLIEPLEESTVPREEGIPRAFHGNQGLLQPERLWERHVVPIESSEEPTVPREEGIPRAFHGNQGFLQPERVWEQPVVPLGPPLASLPCAQQPVNIPPTPATQTQGTFKVPPLPGMPYPYDPAFEQLPRDEQMVVFMQTVYGDNLNPPEEIGYGHKLTGFENILGPYDPEAPFGYESYISPSWPPPPEEVMTGMEYDFVYRSTIPQEEPTDAQFHRQKVMGQGVANVCRKYNLKTAGEFQKKAIELMKAREQRQNP